MRSFDVDQANLKTFISAAQGEPIVLTQSGAPIAIIERVDGMDQEQIELAPRLIS
jgi:antitoxin (DNA-binding transcriptional repressor) of toxin-antitoxin stability system